MVLAALRLGAGQVLVIRASVVPAGLCGKPRKSFAAVPHIQAYSSTSPSPWAVATATGSAACAAVNAGRPGVALDCDPGRGSCCTLACPSVRPLPAKISRSRGTVCSSAARVSACAALKFTFTCESCTSMRTSTGPRCSGDRRSVALWMSLLTNQCTCAATACGQPPVATGTEIVASTDGAWVALPAKLRTSSGRPLLSVMIEGCAGVVSAIALLPAGSADLSDVSATPAAEFVAAGAAACAASVALVPVPLVGAAEVEAAVVVVAADVALLAGPVVVSMAGSDAGSPAVILAASRVTEIAGWPSPAEPAAPAAASVALPAPPAPVSCMPLAASSIASITGSVGAAGAVSAAAPRGAVLIFAPGLPP